ncbi:uncharacterized protein LOC143770579 [Ranitomeya variabilis]|uniref:uncharacterized protein LOC143770579 n=1 Tax=Ranitomeya variabilis TaxID=490064 RepID=UPI004057A693
MEMMRYFYTSVHTVTPACAAMATPAAITVRIIATSAAGGGRHVTGTSPSKEDGEFLAKDKRSIRKTSSGLTLDGICHGWDQLRGTHLRHGMQNMEKHKEKLMARSAGSGHVQTPRSALFSGLGLFLLLYMN